MSKPASRNEWQVADKGCLLGPVILPLQDFSEARTRPVRGAVRDER